MKLKLVGSAADRRLLDESRSTRSMRWIMAIMLFLTVLAAALGLAMVRAGAALDRQLAGRLTVQVVEADAARRSAATETLLNRLNATGLVTSAVEVDRARLAAMLKPWLGEEGEDPDLPVPTMIDVDLSTPSDAAVAAVEAAAKSVSATARVDRHATWMSPVANFLHLLTLLAAGLVALMAAATATVVFLAARAGLDTHRDTIGVLHMLGSTDVQVARLFQRRIALEALFGGLAGTLLALMLIFFLGLKLGALGSDLASGVSLGTLDWIILGLLPVAFAMLATLAARRAILAALRRVL